MPYCTQAQLQARIPNLVAQLTAQPELFEETIAEAITWAQSEIDFELSEKYPVPWADADVPPGIKQIAADLATGFFYRSAFSGGGGQADPKLADSWDKPAREKLNKLRDRKDSVPGATVNQAQVADSVAYHTRPNQHSQIERMDFQGIHGFRRGHCGPQGGCGLGPFGLG